MPNPITVTVSNRDIDADPPRHEMKHTETVRWESANDQKFLIRFKKDSPFKERVLSYEQATRDNKPIVEPEEGQTKQYDYSVISHSGLELDPTIIIEKGP